MRVIVSIKPTPGGANASQATRYIAYRDRDEKREGTEPRRLFSEKEDDLSFWKANQALTGKREPKKAELMHFAISFRKEDADTLFLILIRRSSITLYLSIAMPELYSARNTFD